jgi:hypothetical protein
MNYDTPHLSIHENVMNDNIILSYTFLAPILKALNAIASTPDIKTLMLISGLSGIIGVIAGFFIQWFSSFITALRTVKKRQKLIDFELKRIMDNAELAIETSSYLLDNFNKINRKKISIPTRSVRMFYEKHFADVAVNMDENRMQSIVNAFDYVKEMDDSIDHLDVIKGNNEKRIYNYEYTMSLAAKAYKNASNALEKKPLAWDVLSLDHQLLATELGHECTQLKVKKNIN